LIVGRLVTGFGEFINIWHILSHYSLNLWLIDARKWDEYFDSTHLAIRVLQV
jgi:hypothetical protein